MLDSIKKYIHPVTLTAVIIFFVLLLLFVPYYWLEKTYQGKVYPGLTFAGSMIGGWTPNETRALIENKIKTLNEGVMFSYQNKSLIVNLQASSLNIDNASPIVEFDADKTLSTAMAYGRGNNLVADLWTRFGGWRKQTILPLSFVFHQDALKQVLQADFGAVDHPAINAALQADGNGNFKVISEKSGQVLNYQAAGQALSAELARGVDSQITLRLVTDEPTVFAKDFNNVTAQTAALLDRPALVLLYNNQKWSAKKKDLAGWLDLAENNNQPQLQFQTDKIKTWLAAKISSSVDQPAIEPKFNIATGSDSIVQFATGQDGIELDQDVSALNIVNALSNNATSTALVTKVQPVSVLADNAATLNIKEIVGVGTSNFALSPPNRRHNIATGAAALSGLLIKPGQEFSTIKALGDIGAASGYLPELVIKGKKTVPEYGGGLCQVGTTMFRVAINAGLPITERQNHSYRVVYYEPAGTDATIYSPQPDLKFMNDTGNYLLIQSAIKGNILTFTLWGTRDGRAASSTYPVIYNIVKPPAPNLIPTTDLKPGQQKCSESAHNGADAYFDYMVTYPDGKKTSRRFKSHYVPWQKVCLVGATSTSATAPAVEVPIQQ